MDGGGISRRRLAARLRAVDQGGALAGVGHRKHPRHGDLAETRVGYIAVQVGIRQFLGFNLGVQLVHPARRISREREEREDVEHLDGRDALAIGRQLIDFPTAVYGGDGLHPLGFKLAQIGRGHFAAEPLAGFQDGLGDRPTVKRRRALGRDQLECGGHLRVAPHPAQLRRPAVAQKDPPGVLVLGQLGFLGMPRLVNDFGDGITVVRVVDGGLEQIVPGKASEALVQFGPTVHASRHGDGLDSFLRHGGMAHGFQHVDGEPLGRPAAGIDGRELAGFGLPINGEQVSAEPAALRLDDAQRGVGGDGRVHRGTAAGQHLGARLRGERLAGGHDAAIGDHHGPGLGSILGVRG